MSKQLTQIKDLEQVKAQISEAFLYSDDSVEIRTNTIEAKGSYRAFESVTIQSTNTDNRKNYQNARLGGVHLRKVLPILAENGFEINNISAHKHDVNDFHKGKQDVEVAIFFTRDV